MQLVDAPIAAAIEQLPADIDALLSRIGEGTMLSVPYDTAWLARLSHKYPNQGFDQAIHWLTMAQHADGSWGSDIVQYHDRIICTLAAIVALSTFPSVQNERRIKRGMHYLHKVIDLVLDDANDTVNFRGIAPFLMAEAAKIGLDVPEIASYKNDQSGSKLARLKARPDLWPNHPISHSLECFEPRLPDAAGVIGPGGSIAASPSATAALLLNSDESNSDALAYLQRWTHQDGGAPDVAPIDLFEITWSLNVLRQANAVCPDQPRIRACLNHVWSNWNPVHGLGFSTAFAAPDLDDTATAFSVLDWGGYPVKTDVFASYEQDTCFRCYPDETDPSLSANIRLLLALNTRPDAPHYADWVAKIVTFIHGYQMPHPWTDKWHTSPFYLSSISIPALAAVDYDLAAAQVHDILRSQKIDGGWGHFGFSTAEETAYALQSLLYWHCNVAKIEDMCLRSATQYLSLHRYDRHVPLWIGKCLYTPPTLVGAAILAALNTYATL